MEDLPQLEQTVVEIVVELLLLKQENRFPELIFSQIQESDAVRVTAHYVTALLAYGMRPGETALDKAPAWFKRQFPRYRGDSITPMEMNRLAVLLRLGETDPSEINSRLVQLRRQEGRQARFDVQPGWPEFDTLWALEMFALAYQHGLLDESVFTKDEIGVRLSDLLRGNDLERDKDIALALRLYFDLFGSLEPEHEAKLDELILMAHQNRGLWGMRESAWRVTEQAWYEEMTEERLILSAPATQVEQTDFRKTVLSTLMVIEYLSPLRAAYPRLDAPIDNAMKLWWLQFAGQQVPDRLRTLFPKPYNYNYLLVLCRTLRAVREYVGKPLRDLDTLPMLMKLADMRASDRESTEITSIRNALRRWIKVDLDGEPESLRLGFSDAHLVRVKPLVRSPLSDDTANFVHKSLVIKYGPQADIEKERKSYEALPESSQHAFVRIPEASYTDPDSGQAFVVMEDLRDYVTLYEARERLSADVVPVIADRLSEFLQAMHRAGSRQLRNAPNRVLRDIYLHRMLEYVDRVFGFLQQHEQKNDGTIAQKQAIQYELFECIGEIISHQQHLDRFPLAHMHGDLHLRNIMVKGLGDSFRNGNELLFKLIDLEFMRPDGDAAFDAGQLIVDLELVSQDELSFNVQKTLAVIRETIEASYLDFGVQREDLTFPTRLELAKARAILRIAKGKTKRGSQLANANRIAEVERITTELVGHAQQALEYLRGVSQALKHLA